MTHVSFYCLHLYHAKGVTFRTFVHFLHDPRQNSKTSTPSSPVRRRHLALLFSQIFVAYTRLSSLSLLIVSPSLLRIERDEGHFFGVGNQQRNAIVS